MFSFVMYYGKGLIVLPANEKLGFVSKGNG